MKKVALILAVLLVMGAVAGCASTASNNVGEDTAEVKSEANENNSYTFSLITMDTIDQFWLQVKEGAQTKADEVGVTLSFDAPVGKTDAQAQSDMVENAISNGVDGIMISPTDKEALAPAIEKAAEKGIPVVYVGTMCSSDAYITSFTTDNYAAGAKAADELASLTGGKGQVAVVCAQQGDDSGQQREGGFSDKIKSDYPDMEVVSVVYSNGEAEKAMNLTTDLLATYPDLVGIFSINEGSTIGVAQALAQSGVSEEFACIGFDLSDNTREFIKNGTIAGVIVQDPKGMGSRSVEALYQYLVDGVTAAQKDTFTDSFFVTADNVDEF